MWQFPADLHLIDWLEELNFDYDDVITDHDLADEVRICCSDTLLQRYNAVVTGHPEYYPGATLDAREEFLAMGRRGIYLAGNGSTGSPASIPRSPG